MPEKFVISTAESTVELEYDNVKSKKLISFCEYKPIQWLQNTSIIVLIVAALVFIYDFFKDVGRDFSATKDLFNGKQGGVAKYLGFTKGNITRSVIKYSLIILSIVLFYLSSSMADKTCSKNTFLLESLEPLIKYNDQGIPVEIVIPKK